MHPALGNASLPNLQNKHTIAKARAGIPIALARSQNRAPTSSVPAQWPCISGRTSFALFCMLPEGMLVDFYFHSIFGQPNTTLADRRDR